MVLLQEAREMEKTVDNLSNLSHLSQEELERLQLKMNLEARIQSRTKITMLLESREIPLEKDRKILQEFLENDLARMIDEAHEALANYWWDKSKRLKAQEEVEAEANKLSSRLKKWFAKLIPGGLNGR